MIDGLSKVKSVSGNYRSEWTEAPHIRMSAIRVIEQGQPLLNKDKLFLQGYSKAAKLRPRMKLLSIGSLGLVVEKTRRLGETWQKS